MIPSVKSYIDLANSDQDQGDGERARVVIPPSELIKLGEWRRREYTRQAREKHDLELAKMEEAKAIALALEGQPRDAKKPYCLPKGMALEVVWGPVLDYICDLDDIIQVRETCQLFRRLLERKYVAFRLNEVVTKFANEVGGLETLQNFRLICRSSKAAVDKAIVADTLKHPSFFGLVQLRHQIQRQRIPKPRLLCVDTLVFGVDKLKSIVRYLELQNLYNFPLRMTTVSYLETAISLLTSPDEVLVLRTKFERLLEFVGGSIRSFEFRCAELNFDESYSRLRAWITLMPNLAELSVMVDGDEDIPPHDPNQFALQPFPTCPMLKRFTISLFNNIVASSISTEILRANPTITEVNYYYYAAFGEEWERWKEEEFHTYLSSLETMQLTRFDLIVGSRMPPLHLVELRFAWPLKHLSITRNESNPDLTSRSIMGFVNSFGSTLEELNVDWRMEDTGGFLVLPKVHKLKWKVWPEFMTLEFVVGIENLLHLDVDLCECPKLKWSFKRAKRFIDENNLPPLFPALKKIRVKRKYVEDWETAWKS